MSRVAERFGRAAATYDGATAIQRQAADALAALIMESGPPPAPRAAEFGCGTGYLSRVLNPRLQPSLWLATDLAPAMVSAARLRQDGPLFAVMDAVRPALPPGWDIICSSLALQWLDDPAAVLARWRALVRPGGRLAVATLAQGSFAHWRAALASAGVADPGPAFASLETVRGWFAPEARFQTLSLVERHPDALAFARAARAAGIDAGSGRALDAGAMRKALRLFEAQGSQATYEVALAVETVG